MTQSPRRRDLHHHVKVARRRFARRLIRWFGPTLLRAWSRSWRITIEGQQHLDEARRTSRGHFMALWHGRMVVALPYHASFGWHVLVSPSSDGDLSEELLSGFGYKVIRGSSSRGGARALREMIAALNEGAVMIITPDGPRGPRHSMNPGLAWMVRATGFPVIPCGVVSDPAWRMNSWDKFAIPKYGARVAYVYRPPIWIERRATDEDLARITDMIRDEMLAAERLAFESLGVRSDH